ncbi:MAG: 2-phospho-L-lactate guanylyltransferase [Micromonosporaceae bacterium]
MSQPRWAVVVPVKPLSRAKSRLRQDVPGVCLDRLALAFALDTVAAALASDPVAEVLVVTDDDVAAEASLALGARVAPDRPRRGLNPAVRYGASLLTGRPVAALAGDLPALRPAELAAALDAATALGRRCFVPDAPGSGTVLLAAPAGVDLDPRFGAGSARAHEASGAAPLAGDWPTLRRDVDTAADLASASRLGLGPRATALLDR